MRKTIGRTSAVVAVLGVFGVIVGGCLDRPVVHSDPTTSETFVTKVQKETIDKVDLLFMIDNSASMGDKQTILSLAVPLLIGRLVGPNCIESTSGNVVGTAQPDGTCPAWGASTSSLPCTICTWASCRPLWVAAAATRAPIPRRTRRTRVYRPT